MSELAFDTDVTAADLQADGNILVIAPETSTLTGTNIINNGVCDNLLLTDGKPFVAPQPFTAATATYSRNVTSRFGTICMPFPISSDANTKYYTLDKIEGSTLYLKEETQIAAGVPAVLENLTDGGTVNASGSNVAVQGTAVMPTDGELKLIGTYQPLVITDAAQLAKSYYISKDQFHQATNSLTVNPFRAYFTYTGSSTSKVFDILTEDDMTAISSLAIDGADMEGIYDVQGVKHSSLQKGLNIVKYGKGKVVKVQVK